jgi:MFS family permease
VLYGLQLMQRVGSHDPASLIWLTAGAVVLLVWYRYERSHPHPLVDVKLVFRGVIAKANLIMMLVAMSVFQVTLLATLILQQPVGTGAGFGLSATLFGAIKLPGSLLGIVAAPLAGHLAAKHGARAVLAASAACTVACFLLMSLGHDRLWAIVTFIWSLGLLGAALYTCVPNLIIEHSPAERTGELVGFATVIRHLSGGIGTQLVLLLLATSTTSMPGSTKTFPTGAAYTLVSGVLAVLVIIVLALVRSIPATKQEPLKVSAVASAPKS